MVLMPTFHPRFMALGAVALGLALWGAAPPPATAAAPTFDTSASHAYLMDFDTGAVLFEKNADQEMGPSSMSKLMTVYMVFERLASGALKLEDTMPVSLKAKRKGGSKMFVRENTRVSVEDLLRGIIVVSGNDACIVVAEYLATSETAFAAMMTERGRELGLLNSRFANSTGWPDPDHVMSAHDIATLARRLIADFPQYYGYFSESEFTYTLKKPQPNRNPLLGKDLGVDGLKTGHTEAAGYGLVASALRDGRRLIAVVNGLDSKAARALEPERLLNWGYREFDNYALFRAGETVTRAEVWLGDKEEVSLVIAEDVTLTLPRQARRDMVVKVRYTGPIPSPIIEGHQLAVVEISAPGLDTVSVPLLAGENVNRLGFFGRLGAALTYLVWGAVDG